MMAHMFVYDGALSEAADTLTLDTEGPAMTGGGTARYRDVVRLDGDDTRIVTSEIEMPDGTWINFMTARFARIG
jgi:uncharacterized protein YqkB